MVGEVIAEFGVETVCRGEEGIAQVEGRWAGGRVEGRVLITFTNHTTLEGRMRRGALHGLVRTFR